MLSDDQFSVELQIGQEHLRYLYVCTAKQHLKCTGAQIRPMITVTDSKGEVCVDPGEKGAILEAGGPSPPEEGKDWQLASDSRGEET